MFNDRKADVQTAPEQKKPNDNSANPLQFWRDIKENEPLKSDNLINLSDRSSVKSDIPEKTELDAKKEKQGNLNNSHEEPTLTAEDEFKKLNFSSSSNKFNEYREMQRASQAQPKLQPRDNLQKNYYERDDNNNLYRERDYYEPREVDYRRENEHNSGDSHRRQHYDYGNNNRHPRISGSAYPPIQPMISPEEHKRTSPFQNGAYTRDYRNERGHRSEQLSFSDLLQQSQQPSFHGNFHTDRRTLYVGNLHQIVNEHELTELFKLFGKVVSCKIHKEHQHKSYCFIEFEEAGSADAARIAMNQRIIHKIPIEVNWANTNSTLYNKKRLPQDKFGVFVGDLPANMTNETLSKCSTSSFAIALMLGSSLNRSRRNQSNTDS